MGEPGAGQGGTCQVCTSQFGTVQARIGQVKTSQAHQVRAGQGGTCQFGTGQVGTGHVCTSQFGTVQARTGQVSAGQNGQILLGTRVWPYSVLLVLI